MRFALNRNIDLALKENIACKDDILKEYKKIRHEYNNMLQSIICFIEEEDWDGLKKYKDRILEKSQLLNLNSLTQLVKINDMNILSLVYNLLIKGKNDGIPIYLTIYKDIDNSNPLQIKDYKQLEEYLNNAYNRAIEVGGSINFKISGNDEGICFSFENTFAIKDTDRILEIINPNSKLKAKNIFFNTFIETDKLVQEILTPFTNKS